MGDGYHSILEAVVNGYHSVLEVVVNGYHSVLEVVVNEYHSVLEVVVNGYHSVLEVVGHVGLRTGQPTCLRSPIPDPNYIVPKYPNPNLDSFSIPIPDEI